MAFKFSDLPAAAGQDDPNASLAPVPTDAAKNQAPIDLGTEAFRAVAGGARGIYQGALETISSVPDPLTLGEKLLRTGLSAAGAPVSTKPEDQLLPDKGAAAGEMLRKTLTLPEVEENQTTVGAISRELVKWVGGTMLLRKVSGIPNLPFSAPLKAKITSEVIESAVAGYVFTDPHAKNLGNLLENVPMLQGPITDFMAQDPDSPEAINKLRGALENSIFGALVTPVVHAVGTVVKAAKLRHAGKAAEADALLEKAVPEIEQQMAAARAAEVPENLIATEAPTAAAAGEAATATPRTPKYEVVENVRFKGEKPHQLQSGENMIVAKDKDGEDLGYLWYTQEPNGGFSVRKVFTSEAARKTGVAEELYQTAFEKEGMYKGSTAQSAEGSAFVTRMKAKHPEWFVDTKTLEGVTRVADKEGVLARMKMTRSRGEDAVTYDLEGTLNWSKIDDKAIAQTISDTVAMVKRDLPDTVGTIQTREETLALAKWLGKDPNDLFQTLATTREATEDLGARIVAGRALLNRMGKDIYTLATKLDTLGGTDADRAGFAHMVDIFTSTIDHVSTLRTEAARATAAGRYKVGMLGITTDKLGDLIEKVGGSEYVASMAKRIRMSGPDAMGTAILPPKNIFQKAIGIHNYVWMNGLLSGVKTTAVNLGTTAFNAGLMPGYRMVGGLLQEVTGNPKGHEQFLKGLRQYRMLSGTIFDSLKLAKKAWDVNGSILDMASSPLEQAARLDPISDTNLIQKAGAQWIGTLVGLPGRFLSTQDEFFKQVVYRSHVSADAWVDGVKQGLEGIKLQEFVDQRLLASVNEFGKGIDKPALAAAKMATFTSDLAAKGWLFDRSMAEMLEQGVSQHPVIKGFVLPFLKVPTNLFRQAWEMTPVLNLTRKEWVTSVSKGGEEGAMALGKMGFGTMLWGAAGILAYNGRITGGGPRDPELRRQLGPDWKPYSFVSYNDDGTKSYTSFARFDPFSYFFGLAADMSEVSGKLKDHEWDEITGKVMLALMQNMSSKTYMRSITDGLAAMSGDEPALKSWLRGRVASYVPGIVQVLQTDDEVKNLRGWFDGFKARVPGWSQTVEAQRDNFGEKVMAPMGYPYTAVNPFVYHRGTGDPVRLELKRLAESDSGARFALPSPTFGGDKNNQVDLREIKNAKGQSAYDRWLELHSTFRIGGSKMVPNEKGGVDLVQTGGGKTLHESITDLIQSDVYKSAAAAQGKGSGLYRETLATDLIDQRMELYKNLTLHQVKREFAAEGKDIGRAMTQFEIGKATTKVRGTQSGAPNIDQLRELAGQR